MKIHNVTELHEMMTSEQVTASSAKFQEFYASKFGSSKEILCSSKEEGDEFLEEIDLETLE